ncbi:SRPBCC family protein [Candidatus Poriferisodalis sp.]|uniref:SRPBCC family protein n=1 Tax=Candidatus Poriferisodalis sp. TaxID=3101277 RepID=UPI003B012BF4
MELKNEFRVGMPTEQAWSTLTDVEFIAPCMPGAQLTEIDGDEFKGGVKVKVGPITAQYKGSAKFVELDKDNRRIVLEATGRDSRGAGNAAAEVIAEMTPDGDGTVVSITTDLKVTGKVAQFGRGVMADVTEKLIGQFVDSLEQKLSEVGESDDAEADPSETESAEETAGADSDKGRRAVVMDEPEPVDLLGTAGRPLLKRLLAPVAVVAFFLLNRRRRRRRRQG